MSEAMKWLEAHEDKVVRVGLGSGAAEITFIGILRSPSWYGEKTGPWKVGEIFMIWPYSTAFFRDAKVHDGPPVSYLEMPGLYLFET
jgi:hypothetical protein